MSTTSTFTALSLIRDVPEVNTQASQYPVITIPKENAQLVPDNFDGRDSWNLYIRPPSNTRGQASFAIVAKDVLNDRFSLLSGGQIGFDLDHFQILACKDKAPLTNLSDPSANFLKQNVVNGTLGYSVYDAWEFIYSKGLSQFSCFSFSKLKNLNKPTVDTISYEQKIKDYGFQCSVINGAEDTQCLTKWNNIPIAKRIFLSSSIYNVTSPEMTVTEKIAAIKYDLTKWGPLAAGFVVYENFLTWNGQNVYKTVEGKILGGHYVSIVGWRENFWICRNNWGAGWGLLGCFQVKMGMPELGLEDNVSACMPMFYADQPSLGEGMWKSQKLPIEDMAKFNPTLLQKRQQLDVNYKLFYSNATIAAIQTGKVHGNLTPLIPNPKLLPNLRKFWVMDIQNFNFETEGGDDNKPLSSFLTTNVMDLVVAWCMVVIGIAIFVWIYNKKT